LVYWQHSPSFAAIMRLSPIILGAGAFLAYRLVTKGYGISTLNYYIQKLSLSWDGATPILYITLGIQNPSSASMEVRSFSGNLYANDYLVGNVSTFRLTEIKANSQTFFVVAARLSILGIVSDLINIINGQSSLQQTLKLTGTLNVDGVPVPVSLTYKIF